MHAIQFSFVIDITAYLHSGTKQSNLTSICIKKLTRPREPTARTCMQSSFYGSKWWGQLLAHNCLLAEKALLSELWLHPKVLESYYGFNMVSRFYLS